MSNEAVPMSAVDPHSFWSAGSGSGSRWAKMNHKKKIEEMYCFELLNVLFRWLETWTSYMEA
jgi:hypothetical protein